MTVTPQARSSPEEPTPYAAVTLVEEEAKGMLPETLATAAGTANPHPRPDRMRKSTGPEGILALATPGIQLRCQ